MKKFNICIESYYSNNSDYPEYDIYYVMSTCLEEAKKYAKECIDNWNKNTNGIIYHVYRVVEANCYE